GARDLPVADPELALANLVRLRNVPPDPEQTLVVSTSYTADHLIARFSGGGFEDSRPLTDLRRDAHHELVSVAQPPQAPATPPPGASRTAARSPTCAATRTTSSSPSTSAGGRRSSSSASSPSRSRTSPCCSWPCRWRCRTRARAGWRSA